MVTTKNEKESVLLMVGVLYSILSNTILHFWTTNFAFSLYHRRWIFYSVKQGNSKARNFYFVCYVFVNHRSSHSWVFRLSCLGALLFTSAPKGTTSVLLVHSLARYKLMIFGVNTNASATYSPMKVVNMTNGYSKLLCNGINKPKIHVKPIKLKILTNTAAVMRFFAWYVASLSWRFVFRIAITVKEKSTMLNSMAINTGRANANNSAVGLFIQHNLVEVARAP